MYTNILLTSDGSELSEKAIRTGIAFAKSINAKVTGFYAEHKPSLLAYGRTRAGDVTRRRQVVAGAGAHRARAEEPSRHRRGRIGAGGVRVLPSPCQASV